MLLTRLRRASAALVLVLACLAGSACAGSAGDVVSLPESTSPAVSVDRTSEALTLEATTDPVKTVSPPPYAGYTALCLTDLGRSEDLFAAETAECVDVALERRNAAVEAALGVDLTLMRVEDVGNAVQLRAQAEEEQADFLHFASARDAASLCAAGGLADLAALGVTGAGAAGVSASLTGGLTLVERCYFLFGDATFFDCSATYALLVDAALADKAGIDLAVLREQILAGRWTTEDMLTLVAERGFALGNDAVIPLLTAAGGGLFCKAEGDVPILRLDARFSQAYAAMQHVMQAMNLRDEALFSIAPLSILTEVEAGTVFALPLPTVEAGEPYRAAVAIAGVDCIAVPASPSNPSRTGAIISACFAQASDTVAEAVRAPLFAAQRAAGGDAALLELILENRTCSIGMLFDWGDLADSLVASVGVSEQAFRAGAEMRFAAAERAMEILLSRLE